MTSFESTSYDDYIEEMRDREYPMLKGTTYLDHAGTTLYARSLIDRFAADMMANLYGNPHSASSASQLASQKVDDVRLRLLRFLNADPADFDVVFVANATAGIKLVMEGFRNHPHGFWYGYHRDCHTSLVGVREVASESRCFASDDQVEGWLSSEVGSSVAQRPALLAYPAQSNMNGRRLPLDWRGRVRAKSSLSGQSVYTLLDAAAQILTSPIDLSESSTAPDFVVLSLYKIFGFPDLGALIVRKESGRILQQRRYFGGGTVEMVVCMKEQWHARKVENLHDQLEDGTLPIHSIVAVGHAMDVHRDLFGTMEMVSEHTTALAKTLYSGLMALKHGNGRPVCKTYEDCPSGYGHARIQGPVIAFNIRNACGAWVSNTEVEKLAAARNIQLRTGAHCNPGGTAHYLELAPWEMKENFSAGQRCGSENDVMGGKPTGTIRVSLGAMSTMSDVRTFVEFVREFFVERESPVATVGTCPRNTLSDHALCVESVTVYPIKSCAGWRVPKGMQWEVHEEGLAWDREWCLLHQGTGVALSQKRYPSMALIRPSIDLEEGRLRVYFAGGVGDCTNGRGISVPLSRDPTCFSEVGGVDAAAANVCGDRVTARTYRSADLDDFFTQALGVPCRLARFPPTGKATTSMRHSKIHLQQPAASQEARMPGSFPDTPRVPRVGRPILLSNESPVLVISRSSVNRLNEQIKAVGGKATKPEVFRANIVVAEHPRFVPGSELPYAEDRWTSLRIGQQTFQMLGSCRRCQMICVDQDTGRKNEEPFVTLAKTRRRDGKVYFGQHMCPVPDTNGSSVAAHYHPITSGDIVQSFSDDETETSPARSRLSRQ